MQSVSALSLQYIQAQVQATVHNAPYNPTSDAVQFAFSPVEGQPSMWLAGSWDSMSAVPGTSTYVAQVLVGPGGGVTTLTAGTYMMWIKVSDVPEIPVLQVGQLTVF